MLLRQAGPRAGGERFAKSFQLPGGRISAGRKQLDQSGSWRPEAAGVNQLVSISWCQSAGVNQLVSINRLQFFSWLEAHGLARRNRDFRAGARVASDAGLARTHIEHAKSTQLNAMALGQRLLHALKDGFYRQLGLRLREAGSGYHFVDDVELNNERPPDVA